MNTLSAIDSGAIFNAIASAQYPAAATELGAELVDSWVAEVEESDRRLYKTLLLEAGFFIALDAKTYVVGACDRVMRDAEGVLVEEMKTTSKSKTWTAERWFDSISKSHQIGTYAAALSHGTFIFGDSVPSWADVGASADNPVAYSPNIKNPRILVRAVTKSKPPEIWPTALGATIMVDAKRIETTLNVYRNEAAGIRAKRATGLVPWQLPAKHCEKTYGFKVYVCEFAEECAKGIYPTGLVQLGLSPGSSRVFNYLVESGRIDPSDPNVVCLSASSLEDSMQCSERWRRRNLGQERESKDSLDIGSVLHLGCLNYHQQLMEQGY